MDYSKLLFRASSVGHLMHEPKGSITEIQLNTLKELQEKLKRTEKQEETLKSLITKRDAPPQLAETVKTHLVDIFVSNEYDRQTIITGKALRKGNLVEEDSITLAVEVNAKNGIIKRFDKNEISFSNDFIKGTPDILPKNQDLVIDIKSSYDIYTFHRSKFGNVNPLYYWQLQAYMELTDRNHAELTYCLVDATDEMIEEEESRLKWSMKILDPNPELHPEYFEQWNKIYRLLKYSHDVPAEKRIHTFKIERDKNAVAKLYKQIGVCRDYITENFV